MRVLAIIAVVVGALGTLGALGCGDDQPPDGPRPLVADPAVQVGCAPGPLVGATRAKRVDCPAELIGGRLAAGRVGDFLLENDRVRVIVRGPGEGYYLHGASGGGIVDAAVIGGEDLIKEALPAIDLAGGAFDELVITEAGDDGPAELVVRGPATGLDLIVGLLGREPPPVVIEHHYRLPVGADAIELETQVFANAGTEAIPHDLYDALFMGGRAPAFLPGVGWAAGSVTGELIATGGTTTSYGLVYPAGAADPQLIDIEGIRLVLGPAITGPTRRWLVFGDGSVASVTERAWTLRGTALGVVTGTTAPGVDVVVRAGTAPITIARADGSGRFRVALPAGAYTLRAEAIGRAPGADVPVAITAGADTSADVPAGAGGTLALTVRDDDNAAIPARVVITQLGRDERIAYVGATGDLALPIAPGTWRVSVSRGLEYDAFVATAVVVTDRQTTPLAVTLGHVVDTAGWISLDTHLHSELSTDSTFPVDDRLRAVAAEGVELPVSSDHDMVVDYAPVIAELGLGRWLGALTGTEASSVVWGHVNAWPLVVDGDRAAGGSPRWLDRTPGQVFTALRGDGSHLVQVNHPRSGTNSGVFDAIDLDPMTLIARRDPVELGLPADADLQDLGFDAIEVANASSGGDFDDVFADWLALVSAGHPTAATGSSDSHGPGAFAGEARTYVWVGLGADEPAAVDPATIVDAIRDRHVVVGTAAFVTAGIVTATATSLPGDTVDVTGLPSVTLHIRVQAPAWQPLAAIRIYQGRGLIRTLPLDPTDTAVVRFDADVTVPTPAASSFWVVRVDPAGPGDPVLGDSMPSFTNPLFGRIGP